MKINTTKLSRVSLKLSMLLLFFLSLGMFVGQKSASAACTPPSAPYGTVASDFTVTHSDTHYRLWFRMMAPDTTNNSFKIDIDGTTCGLTVGGGSITANQWKWVNYQNGDINNFLDVSLAANDAAHPHTITMYGTQPGVSVDRIIMTTDTSCQPNNIISVDNPNPGDNCVVAPDNTPPVVSISSPADNTAVNGTGTVTVSASDPESGISKVELKMDGTIVGSLTSPTRAGEYDFTINTADAAKWPNYSAHSFTAVAYNGVEPTPLNATSTVVHISKKDVTPPTGAVVKYPAAAPKQTLQGTVTLQGNGYDDAGVKRVDFYIDSDTNPIGSDSSRDANGFFNLNWDTTTKESNSSGDHTIYVKVIDKSDNVTRSATVTFTIDNSTPLPDDPPTISITDPLDHQAISGTYDLQVDAHDERRVTKVEYYIKKSSDSTPSLLTTVNAAPFTYSFDTSSKTDGDYTITATAYDNATPTPHSTASSAVHVIIAQRTLWAEDLVAPYCVNIFDASYLSGVFGYTSNFGRADIKPPYNKIDIADASALSGKYGQCY